MAAIVGDEKMMLGIKNLLKKPPRMLFIPSSRDRMGLPGRDDLKWTVRLCAVYTGSEIGWGAGSSEPVKLDPRAEKKMLFRTLTSLLVTGLLTTVSWAAPADSLGLAQSTKGFKINRDASVVDGRADALTKVMSGDQIEASDKPVRVQTTTGGTVLVQGRGAAKFVSSDSLDVLSGDVYVAVPTKSKMSVLVADLMIQPLDPNPARAGQHLIQVSRVNEGRVRITGYNHALSVAPKTGGDALAVIGDKDTVELAKTDKGWVVVQADEPADEDKPADDESGEESEDEEERRGAFWWWWPVGIGALAGGAILIGEALDGDDDDDDDDRGPTSRITSGPSESESEDEESAFTFSFF